MQEHEINTIGDFLAIRAAEERAPRNPAWYRGHTNANWKLIPGYYREERTASESTLIARFKQSAAMLAEMQPKDEFDWLFLMQHYGVPTRLLDWSESPLVALYFAVENASEKNDEDGALWRLEPSLLNKHANIINQDEEFYVPSFEDEELEGYAPKSVGANRRVELFPVATIATRNNARIQAQLGAFTIHHNKRVAIEDIGDGAHMTKFVIPGKSTFSILKELRYLGLSRFSMFPELSSVGSTIKDSLT